MFDILFIKNYVLRTSQNPAAADGFSSEKKQIGLQQFLNCFNASSLSPFYSLALVVWEVPVAGSRLLLKISEPTLLTVAAGFSFVNTANQI